MTLTPPYVAEWPFYHSLASLQSLSGEDALDGATQFDRANPFLNAFQTMDGMTRNRLTISGRRARFNTRPDARRTRLSLHAEPRSEGLSSNRFPIPLSGQGSTKYIELTSRSRIWRRRPQNHGYPVNLTAEMLRRIGKASPHVDIVALLFDGINTRGARFGLEQPNRLAYYPQLRSGQGLLSSFFISVLHPSSRGMSASPSFCSPPTMTNNSEMKMPTIV